jgi:hypothetical protein
MQRLISPSIAQISPSNPVSATDTWLTPDKSDNRTFEVALYLSGLCVNRDLGDSTVLAGWEDLQNLLVITCGFQSGSISSGSRCGHSLEL